MKNMKRIAAALLILSLLIGTALACDEGYTGSTYATQNAYTNNEGIVFAVTGKSYIRGSADPDGWIVGSLPEHREASYLGERAYDYRGVAWYKVYYSGVTGWISSRYTYLSIVQTDYSNYGRTLYASGTSYIRTAPSTDARDLGSVKKGSSCSYEGKYTSDMNGRIWYYVSYRGTTGWISSRYIDF